MKHEDPTGNKSVNSHPRITTHSECPGPPFKSSYGLCIVVPFKNEENNIVELMNRTVELRHRYRELRIIFVNDGSTDQSVEEIHKYFDAFSEYLKSDISLVDSPSKKKSFNASFELKILHLSRNFGHQSAIICGLTHCATELDESWIIGVIDADLQDEPSDFLELTKAMYEQKAEVAYAIRESRQDGLAMRVCAGIFYRLLKMFSSVEIPINAGAFSVMTHRFVSVLLKNADKNPYFPGLRSWVGFKQAGVSLDRFDRFSGSRQVGALGLVKLALKAFFSYPDLILSFILFSGLIMTGMISLVAATVFVLRVLNYITIPGATTNVILILLSIGVSTFFIGVVAHLVNRGVENSSNQKSFIIEREESKQIPAKKTDMEYPQNEEGLKLERDYYEH